MSRGAQKKDGGVGRSGEAGGIGWMDKTTGGTGTGDGERMSPTRAVNQH